MSYMNLSYTTFGLVEANLEAAASCFHEWQNHVLSEYGMQLSARSVEKPRALIVEKLLPLTTPIRTRYAFIESKSNWTVYLDNGAQGTDAASVMPVMARRLGQRAIRVVCQEQSLPKDASKCDKGEFGATIMELYDEQGETRRSICAANDGGTWSFVEFGSPLPFEDLDAYRHREIKRRFTKEMLSKYLSALQAEPFDESWYTDRAVLFAKEGNLPKNLKEVAGS